MSRKIADSLVLLGFSTKYALTQGVYAIELDEKSLTTSDSLTDRSPSKYDTRLRQHVYTKRVPGSIATQLRPGIDFFHTIAEADAKANQLIKRKIDALKKQIRSLESRLKK